MLFRNRNGLGLPILKGTLGKAHKKSLAPKKRGIYGCVITGKSKTDLLYDDFSGGNFIFAQFPVRVFQVDVFASYDGQPFVGLAENVAIRLAIFSISIYRIFKNRGFYKIEVLGTRIYIFFLLSPIFDLYLHRVV